MKTKKGFTIAEVAVSMVIIVIISISFFTLSNYANVQYKKNMIYFNGVNEINNVLTIFCESSFIIDDNFSINNFCDNLMFSYGLELDFENDGECYSFLLSVNEKNEYSPLSESKYKFFIYNRQSKILLNAQILYKGKLIYEMPQPFEREVI